MRSTLAALLFALTLGLVGVGNAADLAACKGTSFVNLNEATNSFNHACTAPQFTLAGPETLTVKVTAEAGFTGTLQGRLQGTGAGAEYRIFSADFLLGSPADASQDFDVPAGTWKLIVTAEFPSVGMYGGSVAIAEATPTESPTPSDTPTPTDSPSPPA